MKRSHIKLGALLWLAVLNLCCAAQTNPLNGSWKADPSTKKFDGPNFSMATDANSYTLTAPGRQPDKTVCDGQPKTDPNGATVTCRKSESGYNIETAKPESKTTISLSPDGKTLSWRAEYAGVDGKPSSLSQTSTRVSGGPGIDGVWHPTAIEESGDTGIVTIAIDADTVLFKESDAEKPTSFKLDGSEVKQPYNQTASVQLVNPHTFKVTYRDKDGVTQENTFVLSEDGKTLTENDVRPGPNRSTLSVTYHKL